MSISVAAPVIAGYDAACWNWTRKFQCVETDPVYKCDSGTPLDTVKHDCSLAASQINSSQTINGIAYITSADYSYRCAFGAWTTNDKLPPNKECIALDSVTTASNYAPAAGQSSASTSDQSSSFPLTETKVDSSVCYSAPVTTCADTCFSEVTNPATGAVEKKPVACTETVSSCVSASNQCNGTATVNSDGTYTTETQLGPDGRCVESTEKLLCQAGSIPKCLTGNENCQLSGTTPTSIQENGFALTQDQTYVCSNQTETCTELTNVSNCVHVGAWGWDNLSIKSDVGAGLAEYNQAMSKLDGLEKGMKKDDPYIFSGTDVRCHYSVGSFINTYILIAAMAVAVVVTGGASLAAMAQIVSAYSSEIALATAASALNDAGDVNGALGANCCKDFSFSGSDVNQKMGKCTADEIKLAVAKKKGLTHYLGEYCSNKGGFPVRQCKTMTKAYCVFDDMLAMVVNEQGRAQLDTLAAADPTATKSTPATKFALFDSPVGIAPKYSGYLNTGHWVQQANSNKSQVWTWVYPAYCSSSAAQNTAHVIWEQELAAATDTKGVPPKDMTPAQAAALLESAMNVAAFQECPFTAGSIPFLTCSRSDDACDAAKLPEGPSGVETDMSGNNISKADVDWRVQQMVSFYKPGDYGVTATMPGDASFAAVSGSVNEFITGVGSCHTDGACLYYFSITDKTNSAGAKKRSTEYAQFPLYTAQPSSSWPAVTYVKKDGTMDMADYKADPNRGLGTPITVSNQRFIFHPNYTVKAVEGDIHAKILVEHATQKISATSPQDDYTPLLVPTSLPPGASGWSPYGNPYAHGQYFYIQGGCNSNSRWCSYQIGVDLNIMRHPWGTAQVPRCWGFTLEQMGALDFDKMDLSKWLNSLDLSASTEGLSAEAAAAMTKQVTDSAQSFYSAVKNNEVINKPGSGSMGLVVNSDTFPMLSNGSFKAYLLELAVPSNWPNYFVDQPNNNPVTNVIVDWGDGKPKQSMPIASGGKAYYAEHDYGNNAPGRYKVVVTLQTGSNGAQTLSTYITVAPDSGNAAKATTPDFTPTSADGKTQGEYSPAQTVNGMNQSPDNLQTVSPGTADQFDAQGNSVTPVKK